MSENLDRHIYLYAKNQYQRIDTFNDLRKIHGYYGYSWVEVELQTVMKNLLNLALPYIPSHMMVEFMMDISPEQCWKVNARCKERYHEKYHDQYTYYEAVICKCLSILQLTDLKDIPFPLGEADPKILPLRG